MNAVPLTTPAAVGKTNIHHFQQKVIYVSWMSLSDKVSRDWYIDFLIQKGVPVEYWDVTSLLLHERRIASKQENYLQVIRTYGDLRRLLRLRENRDAFYVVLISYGGVSTRLYRLLSSHNCRMLFIDWGHMPSANDRWRRLLSSPANLLRNGLNRIYAAICRKLKLIKPFEIVFAAGNSALANRQSSGKVVPINLIDYDNWMRAATEENRIVEGRYAVFIDNNLPFQFDIKMDGLQPVSADQYFHSLNRFFALLEAKYGLRVVIAAHPTASYEKQVFGGRRIYTGRTADLVKYAEFVVAHQSTAYCYAVLDVKPIFFIYTDEMYRLYKHTRVRDIICCALYLDAPVINIDAIKTADELAMPKVNRDRYSRFKYDYLTSPASENTTTKEVFWKEIRAMSSY